MIDRVRAVACPLCLAALLHASAYAQEAHPSVGASINPMSPRGEFRQNSGDPNWDHRGALGFDLILPLARSGLLSLFSLRFDYMFGPYDNDCYGCHRSFRSTSLGPEVWVPYGPVRPYAMGGWGRLHFDSFDDLSGIEVDTGVGEWIYGGGVRIPLKRSGYSLDLGVRDHRAGTVSYLGKAGIQRNPDGSVVSVDAVRSRVPFVMYSLGLQYQFK